MQAAFLLPTPTSAAHKPPPNTQNIMTDPGRPWARPLLLRLCYCRNRLETRQNYMRMSPRAMQQHLSG